MNISDKSIEAAVKAIEVASCHGREGPFGGYDYGHPDNKPVKGGRYVIRDFRDSKSVDHGKWLHQTDDQELHDAKFKEMTQHHIVQAAIEAYLAAERAQGRDWEAELDSARLIENQLLEALRPMAERAKSFNDGPDDVWALHAKAGEYNVKEARCAATAYAALVDKGTQGRDWQAIEKLLPEILEILRISLSLVPDSKSYEMQGFYVKLRAAMGKE